MSAIILAPGDPVVAFETPASTSSTNDRCIPTNNSPVTIGSRSCGRIITITHSDPDINLVVDESNMDRLIYERSTDGGITWSEITKPFERPVLKADQETYKFTDLDGDPSYCYRTRYANTKVCPIVLCDPSDPVEGMGLLIQSFMNVEEIKQRYFFGVDLTDDDGNVLPDNVFAFYLLAAIEWLEHELDITVLPTRYPNESHDYYREDYAQFNIAQLDNYPTIQILEWRVQYPSGQTVIVYPEEWIRLDKVHGIVRIVPTAGTLSEIIIGQGGSFLPAVFNGMSHLPDLFEFDYIAGFECLPTNLKNLIGMRAALGPFDIFGDLIAGAGIAGTSLSIDGLSQSIQTTSSATNSGYGARIIAYQKRIKEELATVRRYYKGQRFVSV